LSNGTLRLSIRCSSHPFAAEAFLSGQCLTWRARSWPAGGVLRGCLCRKANLQCEEQCKCLVNAPPHIDGMDGLANNVGDVWRGEISACD